MDVWAAVDSRKTCRSFLETPVSEGVVRDLLAKAARAPSGGNLQPWKVWAISGAPLADLSADVCARLAAGEFGEIPTEHLIYPLTPKEPYDTRKNHAGEVMYAAMGIERDDDAARARQIAWNFQCFGAPVAMFFAIDRIMQPGQWAELGMFMQTFMLLAREQGLHTAPIGAWTLWHRTVRARLRIPDDLIIYCGMGIGYEDTKAPVNTLRTERAPVETFAVFSGF